MASFHFERIHAKSAKVSDMNRSVNRQTEKFIRATRKLSCDEDEAALDRALKRIKSPPEKADKPRPDDKG